MNEPFDIMLAGQKQFDQSVSDRRAESECRFTEVLQDFGLPYDLIKGYTWTEVRNLSARNLSAMKLTVTVQGFTFVDSYQSILVFPNCTVCDEPVLGRSWKIPSGPDGATGVSNLSNLADLYWAVTQWKRDQNYHDGKCLKCQKGRAE
jgi:hypothetical protein